MASARARAERRFLVTRYTDASLLLNIYIYVFISYASTRLSGRESLVFLEIMEIRAEWPVANYSSHDQLWAWIYLFFKIVALGCTYADILFEKVRHACRLYIESEKRTMTIFFERAWLTGPMSEFRFLLYSIQVRRFHALSRERECVYV